MDSVISLGLPALTIDEAGIEAVVPVIRTENFDGEVTVNYSVTNGSATAGEDFVASAGTLTFADQVTSQEIRVPILDDDNPELDETIGIAIGETSLGAVLGAIRTAIITVEDNDVNNQDALDFSQAQYSIDESEGIATITVVRSGNTDGTVSVDYSTEDDYAQVDKDYTPTSGTLTFDSGVASQTFTVPILDEDLPELDEALTLKLTSPVGTDLGIQSTARLIIENDDTADFNFVEEVVAYGLANGEAADFSPPGPTSFDWSPDGTLFVARLDGVVRVVSDSGELIAEPFIDLSGQVNTGGQRGMLGLAVDPKFPQKPYVYLAFTYDPPGVVPDQADAPRVSRLIRITADPATGYKTALPDSEVILLETGLVSNFHAAGALRFGQDGSLFFSHGDGGAVGTATSVERIELLTSLDNSFGKLLRINPDTGEGYPDNPFYVEGEPNNIQSKIYSYGFRNPWRYALHPQTGEPYIGDVGFQTWEEINTGRGAFFGWALYEGGNGVNFRHPALGNVPNLQGFYNEFEDVAVPAIYAANHSDDARAIVLGDFYSGNIYPEVFQEALIFTDFTNRNINALLFDENGSVDSVVPFAITDQRGIAQISTGPDSILYGAGTRSGKIVRWMPTPSIEEQLLSADFLQAEDALLSGPSVVTGDGSEGGYANYQNFTGDFIEWTIDATTSSYHHLIWRYALGYGNRSLELSVNGSVIDDNFNFATTGSWGNWDFNQQLVQLEAGSNTIRLATTGEQGPNVDYLAVVNMTPPINLSPSIVSASSISVPENQVFVVDVNSTDPEGETEGSGLSYSLIGGEDSSLFSIDSITGELSFTTAPDFENPTDASGDSTYEVQVEASDSTGLTDDQLVSVTVTDVNESSNLYEAEDADLTGASVSGGRGSSGGEYVDFQNATGDTIAWTVSAPTAGTYDLTWRYANGSSNRPLELTINGDVFDESFNFPTTGGWYSKGWGFVTQSVGLNSGNNTVELTAIGSSGANFDYLSMASTEIII